MHMLHMFDWEITRSGAGLRVKGRCVEGNTVHNERRISGIGRVAIVDGKLYAYLAYSDSPFMRLHIVSARE